MLDVTPSALDNLKSYLSQNTIDTAVRVTMQRGCSGVALGLALDARQPTDQVFDHDGVTILVDSDLLAASGRITVDFIKSSGCGCGGGGGFKVSSEKTLAGGGSCAGGSCSTGCCC